MSTDLYFLRPGDIVQPGDVYVNAKGKEFPVPKQLIGHRPPKNMTVYRETLPTAAASVGNEPLTLEQQKQVAMVNGIMRGALRDMKGYRDDCGERE